MRGPSHERAERVLGERDDPAGVRRGPGLDPQRDEACQPQRRQHRFHPPARNQGQAHMEPPADGVAHPGQAGPEHLLGTERRQAVHFVRHHPLQIRLGGQRQDDLLLQQQIGRGTQHRRLAMRARQTRHRVSQAGAGQGVSAECGLAAAGAQEQGDVGWVGGFRRGNQLRAPAPVQR